MPITRRKVVKVVSSASSAVATAPDYLSRLPAELLSDIFKLAYPDKQPKPSAPLSKGLLPFFLEVVYRTIKVETYDKLDKLCTTLIETKRRGELVRDLKVWIRMATYEGEPGADERDDPLTPSNDKLTSAFKRLTNLRDLFFSGSTRLVLLVLSPQVAGNCFPQLDELFLMSPFHGINDPFHLSLYTNLVFYDSLDSFNLVVMRSGATIEPFAKESASPGIAFPPLGHLQLDGPLGASPGVPGLLAAFGYICHLELLDTDSTPSLLPLLDAVEEPENICSLTLRSFEGWYDSKLTDALLRFPRLDRLEVGGNCASPSPAFYDILRQLPLLDHLCLALDADVSAAELDALIRSGPRKHKVLKHLTFDQTSGKIGTRIFEDANGVPYAGGDWGEEGLYPDWELPTWGDEMSRSEFEKLLLLAKREGVEVDGDAIEAIEVDEAFVAEMDFLAGFEDGEDGCG
ncbi:hypothetical protein JCM6882_008372 [Rhodosporidiobolus microsporus]